VQRAGADETRGVNEAGGAHAARTAEWPARPVSAWTWPAVLTVVIPVLLLIVTTLA
jgi:hypothetical protein